MDKLTYTELMSLSIREVFDYWNDNYRNKEPNFLEWLKSMESKND